MQVIFRISPVLAPLVIAALSLLPLPAAAQNLFAPVVQVDSAVITEFEVQQRLRFLQVLNAPGATRDAAIEALISDRLRINETRAAGLVVTDEGLQEAMAAFAARGDFELEEFVTALEGAGVSRETLRDFVGVTVAWRDYVRARYGGRVQISDAEIDRALGRAGQEGGIRVLLSEIIMPAPPQRRAAVQARAEEIARVTTVAEFSAFARRFSATPTRSRGGRMDWVPAANLPPALRGIVLGLAPGEVTAPLSLPNAIALFQLVDIEETDVPAPEYAAIEYAAYYINGGRTPEALAVAERLKTRVDVCDDLYGVAQGQPDGTLDRGTLPPGDIPQDIAIELAKLDDGEVSTALTRANGQTLVFLMLCGRTAAINEDVGREEVRDQLRQERLTGYSETLLEQLRADARITFY
ncbi:MAG: peptidylprolyl isomerase [Pseudomonadota bacterium]